MIIDVSVQSVSVAAAGISVLLQFFCLHFGLQQLQQSTEPSYADFACIGRCLSRLGEFLSRLNNSMECSMAAVSAAFAATPPSPKPRRRFQFSFRSSFLDTCDAGPQLPAVRDPLRKYDF